MFVDLFPAPRTPVIHVFDRRAMRDGPSGADARPASPPRCKRTDDGHGGLPPWTGAAVGRTVRRRHRRHGITPGLGPERTRESEGMSHR